MVDQTVLNWNQILDWLRRVETLTGDADFCRILDNEALNDVPDTAAFNVT